MKHGASLINATSNARNGVESHIISVDGEADEDAFHIDIVNGNYALDLISSHNVSYEIPYSSNSL
jgi:hypothetical protein